MFYIFTFTSSLSTVPQQSWQEHTNDKLEVTGPNPITGNPYFKFKFKLVYNRRQKHRQ